MSEHVLKTWGKLRDAVETLMGEGPLDVRLHDAYVNLHDLEGPSRPPDELQADVDSILARLQAHKEEQLPEDSFRRLADDILSALLAAERLIAADQRSGH